MARASFWPRPTTFGHPRLRAALDVARPSVGGSGATGWPSSSGFIAPNHVSAGVLPPKMLPSRHGKGAPAPSQSGRGEFELSNAITAPDICGTTPMNAADLCCWVVPVLPAIGRFQPTCPAAPAAVPGETSSLLMRR